MPSSITIDPAAANKGQSDDENSSPTGLRSVVNSHTIESCRKESEDQF
jgi:hypothetical protein